MHSRLTDIYFFTATINNWQNLLEEDAHKGIIIDSLKYCVDKNRIDLLGFVIMPNHIHLIIRLLEGETEESFQRDFLKFTAQQIIKTMIAGGKEEELNQYRSTQKDRIYQIWERRAKWIEILNLSILEQKLNYIHLNPLQTKWQLVESPQEYKWSSANFYENGIDDFDMLKYI